MRRNKIIYLLIFVFLFLSAGCSSKKDIVMDIPAEDGKYYYSNKDLEFSVVLPPVFIYYQTQRKDSKDYTDIEFFVPISDVDYEQEIPGYAKPMILRVFYKDAWESLREDTIYQEIAKKKDRVYTARFWEKVPSDWRDKWSDVMKEEIINSFSVK